MVTYWKHKFIKRVFKDILTRAWNMPGSFLLEFPQNAIKTRMTFPKVPICLIFEKS